MAFIEHDTVIIGGGLVGCLSFLRLKSLGVDCALIEQDKVLQRASRINGGGIYGQFQPQGGSFGPTEKDLLIKLAPLLKETRGAWERLSDEFDIDPATFCGGMIVACNDHDIERLSKKFVLDKEAGLDVIWIGAHELQAKFPSIRHHIQAATYCADEGYYAPAHLADQLISMLKRYSESIYDQHHVLDVKEASSAYQVIHTQGEITCRRIIVATGAYGLPLLSNFGLHESIFALPIQLGTFSSFDHSFPYFVRYVAGKISLKKLREGSFIVGGGWPAHECSNHLQAPE